MNIQRLILISRKAVFVALAVLALGAEVASAGMRQDLAKARQAFEAGQLQAAAKILQKLLKKYPGNKAAYHLLGRVYYRGGRVRAAARFFRKAGTDFLYTGGAFEYGIAMFTVRHCSEAIKGFKRAENGPYKDYAHFYSGICHYRARRWHVAESELVRAQRLPPNLLASKRRYLQDIQIKKRAEQRGGFARTSPYTPVPVPFGQHGSSYAGSSDQETPSLPAGPGAPTADEIGKDPKLKRKKKKAEEPPKIMTGYSFSVTPKLEYQNETTTSERHEAGTDTLVKSGPIAAADLQGRFDFEPDRQGRQMAAILDFNLTWKSLDVSEQNLDVELDTEGERSENASETQSVDKSIVYTLKPHLTIPFGSSLELDGGGKFSETLPEGKADTKKTTTGGFASVGFGISDINLNLSGSIDMISTADPEAEVTETSDTTLAATANVPGPKDVLLNGSYKRTDTSDPAFGSLDGFASTQSFSGGGTKNWESFSLGATLTQSTRGQPADSIISGTTDELKGVLEATKDLKFGATVVLSGEYAQINEYVKTGVCPVDSDGAVPDPCPEGEDQNAVANGTRMKYSGSFKISPVDWGYGSVAYSYSDTTFTATPELAPDFQRKVPNVVTTLKFLVGVSTSF